MLKEIDYRAMFDSGKQNNGLVCDQTGRTLFTKANHEVLLVVDTLDDYYTMTATNSHGVMELTLFTVKEGVRHPSMYARKFVDFALRHFEITSPVKKCNGVWVEGQSNYSEFIKVYTQTHDLVKAAKSTWSGKLFASFGFTEITARDICHIQGDHRRKITSAYTLAMFSKL